MTTDLHRAFRSGAEILVGRTYGSLHAEYGISQVDWELITQDRMWTPQEATMARAILAQVTEVSLTIAGIPPTTLPVQYVAAVIAIIVSPANRMVACLKAPDTFDGVMASGLKGAVEVQPAERETIMGLVMAYSGGFGGEPMPRLDPEVAEMRKENANAKR